MLRAVFNKSWKKRPTKQQICVCLPSIVQNIQVKQLRHAEYCWRSKGELIRDVFLWTATHGHTCVRRPIYTYIHQLGTNTGYSLEDLQRAINDWDGCERD